MPRRGQFYKGVEWLACWLLDNAEGETITEEQLRPWAAKAWGEHLKRSAERGVVLLYCDDCDKKQSQWAAGPGLDNDGRLRERCNCNCGGWWVSHWAHTQLKATKS